MNNLTYSQMKDIECGVNAKDVANCVVSSALFAGGAYGIIAATVSCVAFIPFMIAAAGYVISIASLKEAC